MRKTTKNQKRTSTRSSRNTKTVATATKRNSKSTKKSVTTPKTTYNAIAKNVYFDGHSYRTRVTIGGVCNSRNFSSKTAAIRWRNEVKRSIV